MKTHAIEIDEDVFQFLKSKAEPFVDTPNDVLRRLLLEDHTNPPSTTDATFKATVDSPPPVPAGTPRALTHILQVIYLCRERKLPRSTATNIVAKLHGVRPQTVFDKYCRQLNLTASEFDQQLSDIELLLLIRTLHEKFSDHIAVIDNYLKMKTYR